MATNLIGTWKVITKTPIDENKATWKFWEENGKVVGSITSDNFETPFEKVVVNGDDFELMTHLDLQFGHIQFDWKGAVLFSFFTLLKIFFSKKLIGTLITYAIAPPSTNGNIIPHIVFSTSSTTPNFHKATTRNTVNTIRFRIFFIDNLLRSTISLLFFLILCVSI